MPLTVNSLEDMRSAHKTAEDCGSGIRQCSTCGYQETPPLQKSNKCCKATYHLTKQSKQLHFVLMSGALFRHCKKNVETTGRSTSTLIRPQSSDCQGRDAHRSKDLATKRTANHVEQQQTRQVFSTAPDATNIMRQSSRTKTLY